MKAKPIVIASTIALVFIAGISLSTSGLFGSTEGEGGSNESSESHLLASDVTSISGNTSLQEIADVYGISISDLYSAFQIDPSFDSNSFETRDLESYYLDLEQEVGNESIQAFVALAQGLPFDLVDVYLPSTAVEWLTQHASLDDAQKTYFEAHTVILTNFNKDGVDVSTEESGTSITGNTTLQDLINQGLTQADIESITGIKITNTYDLVRSYCEDNGLSYGTIKSQLEAALAQ